MKLNRTAVEQAFAQYSGETADGEGTPRQVLCAALCAQCAQQVEALVRPELTQEEEAPWQGALEALAGAEAFYQLLLTEEASAPQSLSVGEVAVSRGAGSERAAALAAEKRRAASPALREEHFFLALWERGDTVRVRSDTWFRPVGKVTLTCQDGTQVQGVGAVYPWREEKADLWGKRPHLLGTLTAPLYRFVGSFPEAPEARGAKLTQGENSYRVLRWEPLTLGGRRLGERALLERWEETHG